MPVLEAATIEQRTREVTDVAPDAPPIEALVASGRPAILKGVARDWPLVRAGAESPDAAMRYLAAFDTGKPVTGYVGAPDIKGRFHYNDAVTGMNFAAERITLAAFLARLRDHLEDGDPPAFYMGSTDIDAYLPGFRDENDLTPADGVFARHPPLASIWIGNRTVAATHYDMSNNAAVCVAGRRRFTLFPPDQVANLYPGPLDPTPGGQVVSMVDLAAPDLDRYPRFAEALRTAEVAELEPGDVLVYPALWWHNVEALSPFNILVNYWWNAAPAYADTPMNTILHALLSLRDRPDGEKQAWRAMFDHYVFGPAATAGAHLPEGSRGALGPLDPAGARRLRAHLLNRFNR